MTSTRPRRHSIRLSPGLPTTTVYDAKRLEELLHASDVARDLSRALGIDPQQEEGGSVITARQYREVERTLLGIAPHRRHDIVAAIRRARRTSNYIIDATGLALLSRLGLDVPAALLMAIIADVADPHGVDGLQLISPDGDAQIWLLIMHEEDALDADHDANVRRIEVWSASLGDGVSWTEGRLSIENLPETIAQTLPGRPLTDLLRHPVIDPLTLTMTMVTGAEDMHVVTTDYRRRDLTMEDVLTSLE